MALSAEQKTRIAALKKRAGAVVLAHTYQPADVQDAADYVGDSYGLSVEATRVNAGVIVFCGVQFMAETAAILNPGRKVVLAEPTAGCPMADMIDAEGLSALKAQHPDHAVVCYVNTSAEVKALSDVCCTSSNAVTIVRKIPTDREIIFVPDKHLGSYVQEETGREMVLWNGLCPTHARITPEMMADARRTFPNACIMIHPEAPKESRDLADKVLSTGQMCSFVKDDPRTEYVVATEIGLIHTLKKRNPGKKFHPVSRRITCPNMRKGSILSLTAALEGAGGLQITIPPDIARPAEKALRRMLEMSDTAGA